MVAYHVVWECVVEQWLGVRRTTHKHSAQLSTHVLVVPYTKQFIFNQSETSPYRTLIQDTIGKRMAGELNR